MSNKTDDCYNKLMHICKRNNPQKKMINIDDYFENGVINRQKFENDLYKYKDYIDCDEFVTDFFSKIQNDLPAEEPVNIPNTEHNVNEFINICNNDFKNCFERLKGIWEVLKEYINAEVTVPNYDNIFKNFPESNHSQKPNIFTKIIKDKTTEVIVNSEIKILKETELVFKNIKTEIQQIISYISHLFLFFSGDLQQLDNKKPVLSNQVNIINNNFTFKNKHNDNNYILFLKFIQEMLSFFNEKFPNHLYKKIQIIFTPVFTNINILHFQKIKLIIENKQEYNQLIRFFENEINNIKTKGGKSRKKKTKNSKTNKKRRYR